MNAKPWYQSKTIWLNLSLFLLAVFALLPTQPIVPVAWAPYLALAGAILNLIMRYFLTDQAIEGSPRDLTQGGPG